MGKYILVLLLKFAVYIKNFSKNFSLTRSYKISLAFRIYTKIFVTFSFLCEIHTYCEYCFYAYWFSWSEITWRSSASFTIGGHRYCWQNSVATWVKKGNLTIKLSLLINVLVLLVETGTQLENCSSFLNLFD